jgi:hypothetical protein
MQNSLAPPLVEALCFLWVFPLDHVHRRDVLRQGTRLGYRAQSGPVELGYRTREARLVLFMA